MRARYGLSLAAVALLAALGTYTAAAQEDQHQHPAQQGQGGGMQGMHDQDMQGAMDRMHQQMNMPMTGDTDADFARMMIPHHQGAIDMAKVELAQGKDPQLRKMAQAVITIVPPGVV
jgi:uncharacterized protein (DUF305 family)